MPVYASSSEDSFDENSANDAPADGDVVDCFKGSALHSTLCRTLMCWMYRIVTASSWEVMI